MLINFSFGNFRSFKEVQTLSLETAHLQSKIDKDLEIENVISIKNRKFNVLKTKAIYGANASGKSNLIKGFITFMMILRHSIKDETILNHLIEKFEFHTDADDQPTLFEIVMLTKNNIIYRYGFEIKAAQIHTEWLFSTPKNREVYWFVREGMDVQVNERHFKEAKKFVGMTQNKENGIIRPNSLFLGAVSVMGGKMAKMIMDELSHVNIISGLNHPELSEYLKRELPHHKTQILNLLKSADIGIHDVGLQDTTHQYFLEDIPDEIQMIFGEEISPSPSFYSKRLKYNKNMIPTEIIGDFENWESEGTQKIFYLAPFLINTLQEGKTLIIDEFDARLHPTLTQKIVSLFNSREHNPHQAQLIFVTHDTSFMKNKIMRRDQICFVEKNKLGESYLKTLAEYKGIRFNDPYEQDYLAGKYGAIPFLNFFGTKIHHHDAQSKQDHGSQKSVE